MCAGVLHLVPGVQDRPILATSRFLRSGELLPSTALAPVPTPSTAAPATVVGVSDHPLPQSVAVVTTSGYTAAAAPAARWSAGRPPSSHAEHSATGAAASSGDPIASGDRVSGVGTVNHSSGSGMDGHTTVTALSPSPVSGPPQPVGMTSSMSANHGATASAVQPLVLLPGAPIPRFTDTPAHVVEGEHINPLAADVTVSEIVIPPSRSPSGRLPSTFRAPHSCRLRTRVRGVQPPQQQVSLLIQAWSWSFTQSFHLTWVPLGHTHSHTGIIPRPHYRVYPLTCICGPCHPGDRHRIVNRLCRCASAVCGSCLTMQHVRWPSRRNRVG